MNLTTFLNFVKLTCYVIMEYQNSSDFYKEFSVLLSPVVRECGNQGKDIFIQRASSRYKILIVLLSKSELHPLTHHSIFCRSYHSIFFSTVTCG